MPHMLNRISEVAGKVRLSDKKLSACFAKENLDMRVHLQYSSVQ